MAKQFNISRSDGVCKICEKQLESGDDFVATVRPGTDEFIREDFCCSCWDESDKENKDDILALWRGVVPAAKEKKKTFVDNSLLMAFFERLVDEEESVKINFRFVLMLILMRKRLLVYEKSEKLPDETERWTMRTRGSDTRHKVIDPKMTQDEIDEVSLHLGEILEGEI